MLRLSIIVPFYNTGEYIIECLNSLFFQDIPESYYEVICINDYSSDNSRNYVIDAQKTHKNIVLLEQSENKQQGAARNWALSVAKGKYIWFVDSDDMIKPNVLAKLYKLIKENDLDLIHFNSLRFSNDGKYWKYNFFSNNGVVQNGLTFLNEYFTQYKCIPTESCFNIYKKCFLEKNNIIYPEGVYFEDVVFTLKSFLNATKMKCVDEEIYFYRTHEDSTMANYLNSPKKMADWVNFSLSSLKMIQGLKTIDLNLYTNLDSFFVYKVNETRVQLMHLKAKDIFLFFKRLRKNNKLLQYYSFYILYTKSTFRFLILEQLQIFKKKYPDTWEFAKSLKSKL